MRRLIEITISGLYFTDPGKNGFLKVDLLQGKQALAFFCEIAVYRY
jgi:hypothetical protein